jgi:hypothetical protein
MQHGAPRPDLGAPKGARVRHTRAQLHLRAEYSFILGQAHVNGWEDKIACFENPAPFSDYRTTPAQAVAAKLCAPCPIFKLCKPYAEAFPPSWGILGGVAWVDGKPFEPASGGELPFAA